MQKTNQKEFKLEKVIKGNAKNYMLNGTATIILLPVGLIDEWIDEWIFSKTKIFRSECESWIRFV